MALKLLAPFYGSTARELIWSAKIVFSLAPVDGIFTLQQLLEHCFASKTQTTIMFLDVRVAFSDRCSL